MKTIFITLTSLFLIGNISHAQSWASWSSISAGSLEGVSFSVSTPSHSHSSFPTLTNPPLARPGFPSDDPLFPYLSTDSENALILAHDANSATEGNGATYTFEVKFASLVNFDILHGHVHDSAIQITAYNGSSVVSTSGWTKKDYEYWDADPLATPNTWSSATGTLTGQTIAGTAPLYDAAWDAVIPSSAYDRLVYSVTPNAGDPWLLSFATVPEPSSTALLGLGGLALILRRRK